MACQRCGDSLFCVTHDTAAIETFEDLWATIDYHLRRQKTEERRRWLRLLGRRIRHWGVPGAHPEAVQTTKYAHAVQALRFSPPLCQCGDGRHLHDEDGSCTACHCSMYANPDSRI